MSLKSLISFYVKKALHLQSYAQLRASSHNRYEVLANLAADIRQGLFLLHISSLGQSHTKGAVTSRRTDGKGELLRVSVGLWMKTFSTDSHTNRLLGSVTVGSVSQEVF